ncbi:Uncharacterized protein APZ42_022445 [Daphnia magna]|uniref:Uncharacterized protein n=1 Tax=Daphnia magna TaxID=35525 RepID=A0A164VHK8_9CRUS|nr:Uncharacterized protein APZ42_022445 [Daphnia magna]
MLVTKAILGAIEYDFNPHSLSLKQHVWPFNDRQKLEQVATMKNKISGYNNTTCFGDVITNGLTSSTRI